MDFDVYKTGFNQVKNHIQQGDSFLCNLTYPTEIRTNFSLADMYSYAHAHYKLRFKNQFVCFSPECFIKIKGNHIYSYPMKGTIDANITDAASILLGDEKEVQEHLLL